MSGEKTFRTLSSTHRIGRRAEDIAFVRDMGFEVDDDNKPAPENVPAVDTPPVNGGTLLEGQEWVWDGIDCRAMLQGSIVLRGWG